MSNSKKLFQVSLQYIAVNICNELSNTFLIAIKNSKQKWPLLWHIIWHTKSVHMGPNNLLWIYRAAPNALPIIMWFSKLFIFQVDIIGLIVFKSHIVKAIVTFSFIAIENFILIQNPSVSHSKVILSNSSFLYGNDHHNVEAKNYI